MSNKTITLPASISGGKIIESFGKINLSEETKEMLAQLGADLSIRYVSGAEKPVVELLGRDGKALTSVKEFIALSGYRRFVSEAIKEVDKKTASDEKLETISFFLRAAKTNAAMKVPARILEPNLTRFNQAGSLIQLLDEHKESISTAVDNVYKDYLLDKILTVRRICHVLMIKAMGDARIEQEQIEDLLFDSGVPIWVYKKLQDRSFVNNVTDVVRLFFPKNNYLKSMTMTTKELASEEFMSENADVLTKSGGIIKFSRTDWSTILPSVPVQIKTEIEAFKLKRQWILMNPYTVKELLELRMTGKNPPIFRETQKYTGDNRRPDNEISRVSREISNILGLLEATWLGIMNLVIPSATPIADFWELLYSNASNWDPRPTRTIFDLIEIENKLTPLEKLRDAKGQKLMTRISELICARMEFAHSSTKGIYLRKNIMLIEDKNNYEKIKKPSFDRDAALPKSLEDIKADPLTNSEKELAYPFTGTRREASVKQKAKKKSGMAQTRISTEALNELSILVENKVLYEKTKDWVGSTFKTKNYKEVQVIAARYAAGEALKHQDKVFGIDFDEYDEMIAIEDYENEGN